MGRPQHRHIYATDAQVRYLTMLNRECFARHIEGYNLGHRAILKSEASSMIDELKRKLGK